ncbi:hypothetical protein ABMA27_001409 [Loxostege sticticalis]|uniref:Mutant cadherin n=1 Tax=Loxostege sticticalis TaxID=481309 RepID=A0ABR3HYE7_LOXSC
MTNVLKCDKCNIVIDEMLAYVQNKVSVVDEMTLVRICLSSFTSEEIKKSKSLLFDSISTKLRKIVRKNKGKEERDIADIINLFKSVDAEEMPVFVAQQLEKLPPITFDHLDCTKLLKDILKVQSEIAEIKSTYATLACVDELKAELRQIKYDSLPPTSNFKVNTRRGAWLSDSGPVGLTHNLLFDESCSEKVVNEFRDMGVEDVPTVRERRLPEDCACAKSHCEPTMRECDLGSMSPTAVTSELALPVGQITACQLTAADTVTTECCKDACAAQCNIEPSGVDDNNPGAWKKVQHRKKRSKYRYQGKSGLAKDAECNFKAADRRIPIFITNIHSDTTEDDIIKYIHGKTHDFVNLEKIIMKKKKGHKAYKFLVPESKLSLYLDENLWPSGIVFRRFIHFKSRHPNRFSVDGLNKSYNE